ncbi:MATE family efflux transporter [Bifidobacterium avesanii]|uniref:MATE family efflux transporter n=1 Tax=Bifidobacterium avesanii TaxID=1798157 RepID=A0A7K3TFM4_9BIFI|nr:MATE family efflux transporter [Bifidobacterium avesanii]KAB8291490.1 MATE family efflux transporter [Bifidobacterium avesanii]NEG77881.1 MATE family efflux transporter [Bifidobacterium avesanii]
MDGNHGAARGGSAAGNSAAGGPIADDSTNAAADGSTRDLTKGRPIAQILVFSLPLVAGTLFQQVYSFADSVVVGRLISDAALGAVGVTYSLNFLTLGFIQGACVGFSIPAAQAFGARDHAGFRRYAWNGAWLCAAMSVAFTAAFCLLARPLLELISTPPDLMDMAWRYIMVIFLSIPSAVLYNHSAALLRAVGDSRHPFYFLVASCAINVCFDVFFITVCRMGVVGSALGNIVGQTISSGLNCWWAFTRVPIFREMLSPAHRADMRPSGAHLRRLAAVGVPMGFEVSVSAIGAIIMQNAINLLGSAAVTAQTAGEKIRQLFTLPMESVGMAMATYAGQNLGARRLDRIKRGLASGTVIQAVYCMACFVVIRLFSRPLVGSVLGDADPRIVDDAALYLTIISGYFLIHGTLMIFRNTLQGMGYSTHAVISGVGELAGRALGAWLAGAGLGYLAICYANQFAWAFALAYCMVMTAVMIRRKRHEFAR